MSLSTKGLGIRPFTWTRVKTASLSLAPCTGKAHLEVLGEAQVQAMAFSGFGLANITLSMPRGAQMKSISGLQEVFA